MSEKKAKKERKETPPTPKVLHEVRVQLTDGSPNLLVSSPANQYLAIQLLCEAIKTLVKQNLGKGEEPNRIISPHAIIPGGFGRA